MLDLLLLTVFILFVVVGLKRPHIACMGYLWVNLVRPQNVSYGFLNGRPLSMIMALICIVSLTFNIKKLKLPNSILLPILMIVLLIWITYTTYFVAIFPRLALERWSYAFETILICLIIPLAVSKVNQLESIILVWLFSVTYFVLSTGVKTLLTGGGYGVQYALNFAPLSESSTLATVAIAILPFIFFLYKKSVVFSDFQLMRYFWIFLGICCIATIIGSYARTGLVSAAVYLFLLLLKTKRKVLYITIAVVLIAAGFKFAPEDYRNRMNTMKNANEETSALGRILVWKWTLNFVKSYPNGGGFESYYANRGKLIPNVQTSDASSPLNQPKAYHNIFIQILGEQGYIGLAIYLTALLIVILKLIFLRKHAKDLPISGEWISMCAECALMSLIILHAGGMFIGVAYQLSFLYLSIIITLSLEKVFYHEWTLTEMVKDGKNA